MLEEERKYEVDPGFTLPDLSSLLPAGGRIAARPPVALKATYYDTADLRLARAGVSLRYRRGDDAPWTVKLPTDSPGSRHEVSRRSAPTSIPADLRGLVTAWARNTPLQPVVVLRTRRRAYDLCDSTDTVLAQIADDLVSVVDNTRITARFRELEVERKAGNGALLDRIEQALCAAGARTAAFTPKHIRALGERASAPGDLPPPQDPSRDGRTPRSGSRAGRHPRAGDVVVAAIRRDVARILNHDPLVRLRETVGDGDTAVHQMRVGVRRLRGDLRTFRRLLEPGWADQLRRELRWLAEVLGAARDAEVLRDRLRRTAAADPLCPLDSASVARVDAELAARHEEALTALDAALISERYVSLVDALVAAAQRPVLTALANAPAQEVLPRLVALPWQRLAYGRHGVDGAEDLDPLAPDAQWHGIRVRAKRARYAVEAVAGVLGGPAPRLAEALARVQDLLGEHQDAAVAAETWLAIARTDPEDHLLAVTAGRLAERERAAIRAARAEFPAAWRAASRRRIIEWLR